MARPRIHKTQSQPWGLITGLLMSAFVTLMGVMRGLDPLVILQRATLAAVATGMVISLIVGTLVLLSGKKRNSWQR